MSPCRGEDIATLPPKEPSPNFLQDPVGQPWPEAPITFSLSSTSMNIPQTQRTPSWEYCEHGGVRISPRGQAKGQAMGKSDVSGAACCLPCEEMMSLTTIWPASGVP